jgi:hypothetical protein
MQNSVAEILKLIPLNLEFYHAPMFNRDGMLIGGYYTIKNADDYSIITSFVLEPLRGCNGICISRKVLINEKYRGKGYGSIFCTLREVLAKDMRYSCIMCTTTLGNHPQQKIMAKNNWSMLTEFLNLKTTNRVRIYSKNL